MNYFVERGRDEHLVERRVTAVPEAVDHPVALRRHVHLPHRRAAVPFLRRAHDLECLDHVVAVRFRPVGLGYYKITIWVFERFLVHVLNMVLLIGL